MFSFVTALVRRNFVVCLHVSLTNLDVARVCKVAEYRVVLMELKLLFTGRAL